MKHKNPVFTVLDGPTWAEAVTGVYRDAVHNLVDINTISRRSFRIIRAGRNYQRPWTRDGSLNSICAASLLVPQVAENTLWWITRDGRIAGQWWDRVIWVVAAWEHGAITGNRDFLSRAYDCAVKTLAVHETQYLNAEYGLFRGPSHLCDGIAGYPSPPAPEHPDDSFAGSYPDVNQLMCTSIQAIYYGAYRCAARMAAELGRPGNEKARLEQKALDLKNRSDTFLWSERHSRYGYFLHGTGTQKGMLDLSQEGAGLAFALWFGLADDEQATQIMSSFHNQPFGMTCVWPHFKRFSDEKPGRHNVTTWPQLCAYWAIGALFRGGSRIFESELRNVTRLLSSTRPDFREIYNSITGEPDGGWQNDRHWESTHDQTWCATGYLGMVHKGVMGMRFSPDGITFKPAVPQDWSGCRLEGIHYRNMKLDIQVNGSGRRIAEFRVNGKRQQRPFVGSNETGIHQIEIDCR